jgi:hypothetical protein
MSDEEPKRDNNGNVIDPSRPPVQPPAPRPTPGIANSNPKSNEAPQTGRPCCDEFNPYVP